MRDVYKIVVICAMLAIASPFARGDVGLLLNAKPNGKWTLGSSITGEGHSAVYLSRICPASPVKLRMCGPGENGSVLQNYEDYKEDQPYEWNDVALNMYLYGVDDAQQRPLFASPEIRAVLQERYREKYLQQLCNQPACISDADANWRDSVAAAFVREVYIFEVHTTVEQDEKFVREFNARPNVNHYSGFRRNCADFSKFVVNSFFPHAAHRDVINDFGMTGPKAIARSFSHYAEKRPDMQFRVIRIEQLPGTYKRSTDNREGTEQIFRSKKWLVPMMIFTYHAEPVFAASYLLTGRFNPDRELRRWPSPDAALLKEKIEATSNVPQQKELELELREERTHEIGDEQQWQQYREQYEEILRTAIDDGVVADRHQLAHLFHDWSNDDRVYLDSEGLPWLEVKDEGALQRVGLSEANVFDEGSNRRLALQLLLARTGALLAVNSHHRELWPEFQADWALLQQAEYALPGPSARPEIASRSSTSTQ